MDPIDAAFESLGRLLREIPTYDDTITTEQDTRLKVVDRFLVEVLGWAYGEIATEERAGSGFVDYKLAIDGFARLIVEAKRDSASLGLESRAPGRPYKLSGPVFSDTVVRSGIDQAIQYCAHKSAELACVTNGREWTVFRGSRLGDGRDTLDGMAFIFPTLEALREHFKLFYDLLSRRAVGGFLFRAHFQEAEGRLIRPHDFQRSLRTPESRRRLNVGNLGSDLERVMTSFFQRISGDDDPDFLAQCFVITRESTVADERLARISEDLVGAIRQLDTANASELAQLIERVRNTGRNEFVLLVGTKGAGKSTFIDRFFRQVMPRDLREDCIVVKVDLADHSGDEATVVEWLTQQLQRSLESDVFADAGPRFEDLQGMFFDEYTRWRQGTMRALYDSDKTAFQVEFGRHLERRREERPAEYNARLLHHIVSMRRKLPCLVFDNADHFTIAFQERVFQYARSLYEQQLCLVLMPITDRTSWNLSREGALRSFENVSLFLPTPPPRRIFERRIEFLDRRLAEERKEPGRGYFLGRGIRLSLENLTAFTAALQSIFLRTGRASRWVGALANGDIRQCLALAKEIVASPHLEVIDLLKAYVGGSTISLPPYKIKKSIIRGRYDIYPYRDNRFVHNLFWLEEDQVTTPLLAVRVLLLLREARRSRGEDGFVTVEQVVNFCGAMRIEAPLVLHATAELLERGLCWSYDPTVTEVTAARRVELSPSGFQHLWWATRDADYLQAMLEVTPIVDEEAYRELEQLYGQPFWTTWKKRISRFAEYLVAEDALHCEAPDHPAYRAQRAVGMNLQRITAGEREGEEEDVAVRDVTK